MRKQDLFKKKCFKIGKELFLFLFRKPRGKVVVTIIKLFVK